MKWSIAVSLISAIAPLMACTAAAPVEGEPKNNVRIVLNNVFSGLGKGTFGDGFTKQAGSMMASASEAKRKRRTEKAQTPSPSPSCFSESHATPPSSTSEPSPSASRSASPSASPSPSASSASSPAPSASVTATPSRTPRAPKKPSPSPSPSTSHSPTPSSSPTPSRSRAARSPCPRRTFYRDADGDGFGDAEDTLRRCVRPAGYVDNGDDCDDSDASVNPAQSEVELDGVDNDCNPMTPDVCPDGITVRNFPDRDGDGFGDEAGAVEACQLLPGYADNSDDCDDDDPAVPARYYRDNDQDGFGNPDMSLLACSAPDSYVANADDCDDNDRDVNPHAPEVLGDGIDNDCDGVGS